MTSPREVRQLATRQIGRHVYIYDSVTSTNDIASALGAEQKSDGAVVLAHAQTAGRGQYGRTWQCQPGTSVLMSILVRPPAELRRAVVLTAWAAVSVSNAIDKLTRIPTRIKWPNDLMLQGRKVGGILIEQSSATTVGIGLNLNQSAEEFDRAGLSAATSLSQHDGVHRDSFEVASAIIHQLDDEYDRLLSGVVTPLETEWKRRLELLGRQIVVEMIEGSSTTGRLLDLSFDKLVFQTSGSGVFIIHPERVRHLSRI